MSIHASSVIAVEQETGMPSVTGMRIIAIDIKRGGNPVIDHSIITGVSCFSHCRSDILFVFYLHLSE